MSRIGLLLSGLAMAVGLSRQATKAKRQAEQDRPAFVGQPQKFARTWAGSKKRGGRK